MATKKSTRASKPERLHYCYAQRWTSYRVVKKTDERVYFEERHPGWTRRSSVLRADLERNGWVLWNTHILYTDNERQLEERRQKLAFGHSIKAVRSALKAHAEINGLPTVWVSRKMAELGARGWMVTHRHLLYV